MSDAIITAESLSRKYLVGHKADGGGLRGRPRFFVDLRLGLRWRQATNNLPTQLIRKR